ncbi:zinc-ribbon domain-containing protein [Citrobacter portucalensis]|uniref:putative zinc ribbon protein n=1 Tax=Citrobacter portucalensis TaxID=1639133 RepID=UPI00242C0146|nr:putative zinc ribbon protein [Citrobacter portucalensis]WFZ26977.1 zinc-ribbon domain-containing protein [Citrobacter portucalensis]
MKCYLANTDNGHFITADEKSWFRHDQSTVPVSTLINCVHFDPEIKAEARLRMLRNSIGELVVPMTVLSWYCVKCGQHYQGEKFCSVCDTGIYSIEDICVVRTGIA